MPNKNIKSISTVAGIFLALPLMLVASKVTFAQEPDTAVIARTLKQYKNENAVFLNYKEKLEIKYEDGELTATSTIDNERLLISDLSPVFDHYDHVSENYFDQITQLNAVAYIPQSNGTFKQVKKYHMFSQGAGGGSISDASHYITSFTGLTKGSVIKLTATEAHPDLTALPIFIPADRYPILHAEYEVVVPKYVDMKFVMKGENTAWIKKTTEEKNGNIIYHFTSDNVPGYKPFERVPSALYYLPQVVGYISSFRLPGKTKDSLLLSDAAHLYKSQYKYIGNLNIKQDTALQNLADKITKGDKTQRQKAEHIYDWVQKNLHYKAFEIGLGGWIPREADTVCKKKYGDCKDMSSLLMQLGRMAGLETYFAWIGTSEKPYTFEETPIPFVSNHMICALKLNGEWLFMDGTHSNLPFGENRDDIQGKEAMIAIDKDTYKIVTIPTVVAEKNLTIDSTVIHISNSNDADVEGRVHTRFVGYQAWNNGFALSYVAKDKDDLEKAMTKLTTRGSDKYLLDKYNIDVSDKGNKDINITGDFTIGGYVNKAGKNYIVNLNVLRHFGNDYIDTTDRLAPWYHDYKYTRKEVVVFDIPANSKVTYLPKNATGKLDDMWSYSINYKTDGKRIILTKEYKLNTLFIDKQHFIANNKAINELNQHYKESVVLTTK